MYMFNLFSKESKKKYSPEDQATIFVDVYLQSKCKDNESVTVTDDQTIGTINIDYKAVVAKKAISKAYALPLSLMVDLSEPAASAVLDDILKKLREDNK